MMMMNNPKYKKKQRVNTPYGKGVIQDLYAHALDPDSDPNAWVYQVCIDENYGLKIAVFQENELTK